ncbi:glycosyltransferase family 2 protein [Desulforudis sp. DRI-14]|jgi:GT2 family glycosyltransferase|uniref:glycosyltransferase family 2 protein n=1 Tax=Desulforudis sp. DRI-14 TaxID=3459793 RepID=UPI004041E7C8
MPKLWSIILNWNNYDDAVESIRSLLGSTLATEIVLVDNGSTDGSYERLQEHFAGYHIYFIRNKANYGFARGVNIGIKFALSKGAEYIFLLNNDAVVSVTCLERLYVALQENDRAGMAGPRIYYYSCPNKVWQGGGYFNKVKSGVVVPDKNKLDDDLKVCSTEVTFLTGCAMLIKQEVFQRVGFFDEDYYFYYEDVDFCLRTIRMGFKLLYVPTAKAWHKIEDIARDRSSPFVMYHLSCGHFLMLRKNFSTPYVLYGLAVYVCFYLPYRILQIIIGTRSCQSLAACIRGTLKGLVRRL